MFLTLTAVIFGGNSCLKDKIEDPVNYTPERENAIITAYIDSLESNGFDVDTSDMGIFYTIVQEGEGDYVMPGDSIGIIYIGYFPENRTIFDASDYWFDGGVWKFSYLSNDLIEGFDESIGLLNKGAEGLFLIPSELGYGPDGSNNGSIPPYSALVFDIKLVDIYQ